MKKSGFLAWAIVALSLVAVVASPIGLAKGPTVQLSISGPGIELPIHTTDPAAIAPNVWGGDFAQVESGTVAEPVKDLPRYQVHFWVALRESAEMKYAVLFVPDARTGTAYVYFPGRESRWYSNNVATILTERNGNWFHAAPEWANAVTRAIGK